MAEDSIIIPIEIDTQSKKELRDLINELKNAQELAQSAREESRRNNVRGLPSGGAPTDIRRGGLEERGGIFGGQLEGEATPLKPRDTSSRAPFKRAETFKELRNEVERQGADINRIAGLAATIPAISNNPLGFIDKIFKTVPGLAQVIAGAFAVKGIVDLTIAELTKDGGWLDRRFKRDLAKEVLPFISKQMKELLRTGEREVRISSYAGQRGGISGTNLTAVRNRSDIYYDREFKSISLGLN